MKLNRATIILSAFVFAFSAQALESDYDQQVNISAGKLHAKMKSNTVIYEKEVSLTQGTIKITGDKLTVTRSKKANSEVMIAEGNVATFYQTQDDGKPLDAEANSIRYDVAKAKITLTGNAQVKQLDSQINGSKIIYFLETEELIVEGDKANKQRVETVFLPAQLENKGDKEENKTEKQQVKEK